MINLKSFKCNQTVYKKNTLSYIVAFPLLAHLSWNFWSSVVYLSVNFFLHFHLLKNHWADFNQTWHKAPLSEEDFKKEMMFVFSLNQHYGIIIALCHRRKPRPKCTILSQFWRRELCGIRYRGLRRWALRMSSLNEMNLLIGNFSQVSDVAHDMGLLFYSFYMLIKYYNLLNDFV